MDDDQVRPGSGPARRGVLKNALVLGAAAPLAGACAATGGRALSSAQLAGQRVVYSYPGLTVPAALLTGSAPARRRG